jgi:rhodanese-related sulfurtransferase
MPYQNLSFVEYRDNYYEKTEHSLIDVRSVMEYAQGHVPNAINIPLQELENRLSEISVEKPVIVICASGNRSRTGAEVIANAGYEHVYNLQGGTMVWMMNGQALDKSSK